MAEALIGGERTRGSALSPRHTRPRRALAHANEAWNVSGIRARRWRSRVRRARAGDRGRGEASALRTGPQNGPMQPPVAAKCEHSGLFLGASHLRPPAEFPISWFPAFPRQQESFSLLFPRFLSMGGIFHGRRRAGRRPSRLGDSLPSFPFFLTQYTEMREAVVGFHFFFAVVCMRWDCESACVRAVGSVDFFRVCSSRRSVVGPCEMVSALFGGVDFDSSRSFCVFYRCI